MLPNQHARPGATVTFLPHRLNRQPIVVRGLTADELWVTVSLSAACGLMLGILVLALTHRFAVVPSAMVACIAAGVLLGGNLLRAKKRGRPETWLPRELQWRLARRLPALAAYLGAMDLIVRSGYWTTRRQTRC